MDNSIKEYFRQQPLPTFFSVDKQGNIKVNFVPDANLSIFFRILKSINSSGDTNSNEPFILDPKSIDPKTQHFLASIKSFEDLINELQIISFVRENPIKVISTIFNNDEIVINLNGKENITNFFSKLLENINSVFGDEKIQFTNNEKARFINILLQYLRGKNGELDLNHLVEQDQNNSSKHQQIFDKQLRAVLLNYTFLAYTDFLKSRTQPTPASQETMPAPPPHEGPLTRRIEAKQKAAQEAEENFFEQIRLQVKDGKLRTLEAIKEAIIKGGYDPKEYEEWLAEQKRKEEER